MALDLQRAQMQYDAEFYAQARALEMQQLSISHLLIELQRGERLTMLDPALSWGRALPGAISGRDGGRGRGWAATDKEG